MAAPRCECGTAPLKRPPAPLSIDSILPAMPPAQGWPPRRAPQPTATAVPPDNLRPSPRPPSPAAIVGDGGPGEGRRSPGGTEVATGAIKRYPFRGTVCTKRGLSDASPKAPRTCRMQKLRPRSKSTHVSRPQISRRNSPRRTTSPGWASSSASTRAGCGDSLTTSPSRRSSPLRKSKSNNPNRTRDTDINRDVQRRGFEL